MTLKQISQITTENINSLKEAKKTITKILKNLINNVNRKSI